MSLACQQRLIMRRDIVPLIAAALAFAFAVTACSTSSHVLIGTARPAISPASVRVYYTPPPKYEEIATVNASIHRGLAIVLVIVIAQLIWGFVQRLRSPRQTDRYASKAGAPS